jgi:hypothetical protein
MPTGRLAAGRERGEGEIKKKGAHQSEEEGQRNPEV